MTSIKLSDIDFRKIVQELDDEKAARPIRFFRLKTGGYAMLETITDTWLSGKPVGAS